MNTDVKKLDAVLSALGIIAPVDLLARLNVQEGADQLDRVLELAAGERQRLGELLRAAEHVTSEQLEDALSEQRRSGRKLGEILVAKGVLAPRELEVLLEFQRRQAGVSPAGARLYLGSILVATEQITREQLADALKWQAEHGGRLGEALIATGYVTEEQVKRGLLLQRRLVVGALTAAMALAATSGVPEAQAAQGSSSVQLSVMARVAAFFRVQVDYQANGLTITAQDIERGYVDVPAASRFSVVTNNRQPYLMDFHLGVELFRAVQVMGLSNPVELGAGGGTVVQNAPRASTTPYQLGYRFLLRADAQPGNYPWPLTLAVHPL